MAGPRIGFVHPPLDAFRSGGNVYNAKLLEHAARYGCPLESLPWRGTALCGTWDLLVWDSLFMDRLTRVGNERVALLLHYLPSLQPDLDANARLRAEAVEHRALAQADSAIATGRCVADAVALGSPGKPVFICEPGVGPMFARARPRQCPSATVGLLTVAHLIPAKGHAGLLDVLRKLAHLPWHWHLAGDGARSHGTLSALRARAAAAGLLERISFHGALPQQSVAALMADSDLLVCPSTYEAYGMAVAEAVASGLPVLSNRVGAAGQLVQHGVTGFLATPGDWDCLGRYLQLMLEDASLRDAFRHNLRHAAVRRWDQTWADFHAACDAVLR